MGLGQFLDDSVHGPRRLPASSGSFGSEAPVNTASSAGSPIEYALETERAPSIAVELIRSHQWEEMEPACRSEPELDSSDSSKPSVPSIEAVTTDQKLVKLETEPGLPTKPKADPKADPESLLPCQAGGCFSWLKAYVYKMRGGMEKPAPIASLPEVFFSSFGAFCSILCIAALHQWTTPSIHINWLLASFGASGVLIFGAPKAQLAQPRNILGGQLIGAVVGCVVRLIFRKVIWLSAALGMSISFFCQHLTKTLHPPGGATALIAASAGILGDQNRDKWAGFSILPVVMVDSIIVLIIALIINNLLPQKRWPIFWY